MSYIEYYMILRYRFFLYFQYKLLYYKELIINVSKINTRIFIMKYIFACFCCFILSSCVNIPVDDKLYNSTASCIKPCSKVEADFKSEIVTDRVVKNGLTVYKHDELDRSKLKAGDIINDTSFSRFYLEYRQTGQKFDGNRQLDRIKLAIKNSDKPVYLIVYVNSWHHNADTKNPTAEVKYFPNILARRSFQNPDKNVIGVYIGWRGEKYKYPLKNLLTPREVAEIADTIGKAGEVRTDIISMVNHVQMNSHSGYSLVMGKSFGARLLSRAFMDDLIKMKSIEDWPLGSRSLLVNLNPAIGANAFDEVFKNMSEKRVDLQRPIWLNMTSKNDTATSWLYPKARFIGQNLSDEPVQNEMNKTYKTIGHYKPYLSHWVTLAAGIIGPNPKISSNRELSECKFKNSEQILPVNKPWFKLPLRTDKDVFCATRHLYENKPLDKNKSYRDDIPRYYTTALRTFDEKEIMERDLGYMWNFQMDESVLSNGSATNLISRTVGYHSADVQTILGRMLDDMLFTSPEK